MKHKTFWSILAMALAGFLLVTEAALAQVKAKTLGKFDGWEAFSQGVGKELVCFAGIRPSDSDPKNIKRGDVYLTISHRPADQVRNELDMALGFPLKKEGGAEIEIGQNKYPLKVFHQKEYEEHAFAESADQDRTIVEALTKADKMVVKAVSQRGMTITDTYSLKGAAQALRSIDEACR